MAYIESVNTVSGKEGRAYAKINRNNEELFFAKNIEANVKKTKSEVKSIGRRMVGHKTVGMSGSGSMTIYYGTKLFINLLSQYKQSGVDLYFDLMVENDDKSSKLGERSVLLMGCNIDSATLTKLDGDTNSPLEEKIEFTFEDYELI